MDVRHDVSAQTYGNDVDTEFEDMDANGEHGLALALIATALDEVRVIGPQHELVVSTILARVAWLVREYQNRTTPVRYV